jgi:N-acetylated-alpha-linked acidic dipeptidase
VNESRGDEAPLEEPPVGTMGGGSDHKGFYLRLGIPAAGFGFGGRGGVYHSMYDTPAWMQQFGDPGYRYHAAVAGVTASMLARIANADILPYDHVALASWIRGELTSLSSDVDEALRVAGAGAVPAAGVMDAPEPATESADALRSALAEALSDADRMEAAARSLAAARDARLAFGRPDPETIRRVNDTLRRVGQELAPPSEGRGEWSRNLIVISDPDNGYSALTLPVARLALRAGDLDGVERALSELSDAMRGATERIRDAASLLGED